jgi:hypothetical protein
MRSKPFRLLLRQLLRDPRRSTQGALLRNLQLAYLLGKEAVVVDLMGLFDLALLHGMDESAVSPQLPVVLPPLPLLRTPICDKPQEPVGHREMAAPPQSLLWKTTMPRPLALQQLLQLQNLTLVELADPYAQVLPEYLQRGENQVRIEDASLACRQHYEV